MPDIFISYARADRDRIEMLSSALERKGYSVWWDRDIAGGAEFSKD
ncbi:MAG: TIR domain-containing protein, partial [Alphaproteobacteria bacterium]|nr:TIR domain-containing protein [Alphaproteobacteria bacterium]